MNQNGRWAPYFSYLRRAVQAGVIGDIQTADLRMNWDHTWTRGTEFEKVHHLILYDFAIHWFDMVTCFFGDRQAKRVFASAVKTIGQVIAPPFLAHAAIEYPNGLATLSFNAHSKFGGNESTTLVGSRRDDPMRRPVVRGKPDQDLHGEGRRLTEAEGQLVPGRAFADRWASCFARSRKSASRKTAHAATSRASSCVSPRSIRPIRASRASRAKVRDVSH